MIIDSLANANLYTGISNKITKAFEWLINTDLNNLNTGKYFIDDENIFAIVQEYQTLDEVNEQMEAHKKYIDVQYMISGEEMVGLSLFSNQTISKSYDEESDFMQFSDPPTFYAILTEGSFMIFYPTDLHMPCLQIIEPSLVKKVVVKVRVE